MNDALPRWLDALRGDEDLARELEIQWLEPDQRAALHAGATSVLEGMNGDERWLERGRARLARSVPVALGPSRTKRVMRHESSTALFFDPERPSQVSLSLAASMSPLTWVDLEATPAALREAFARCFVTTPAKVSALPKRVRTVVDFGQATREQIEEAITGPGFPMIDDAVWYSAHHEDPWLGVGETWGLALMAHLRDARREDHQRYPSFSVRTLFSRSVVTLEQHPFGVAVMEIRYAPAPDSAGVRWVNEIFGSRFPEDLPADLIGTTILQGGHTHAEELDERAARGDFERFDVVARLALAPGEPPSTAQLRAWLERSAGDEEMCTFLANASTRYEDFEIFLEVAARAAGTPIAEEILAKMKPAEPAPPPEEGDEDEDAEEAQDDEDHAEDA